MSIKKLIGEGPNPRYQLRSIAIQDYQDIATARKLLRSWPEITEALGLPRDRWPGLARAWRKIGKDYGRNPPKIAAVASIPGAKGGEVQKPLGTRINLDI